MVLKESPCSMNILESSLVKSNPSPRLSQQFISKDYTSLIGPLYDFTHRIKDAKQNLFLQTY